LLCCVHLFASGDHDQVAASPLPPACYLLRLCREKQQQQRADLLLPCATHPSFCVLRARCCVCCVCCLLRRSRVMCAPAVPLFKCVTTSTETKSRPCFLEQKLVSHYRPAGRRLSRYNSVRETNWRNQKSEHV
ncbi:unnamed protein product, partial [Ectocarpus sp. 4 AP-2014]